MFFYKFLFLQSNFINLKTSFGRINSVSLGKTLHFEGNQEVNPKV